MTRKTPNEADLGLAPTDDEMMNVADDAPDDVSAAPTANVETTEAEKPAAEPARVEDQPKTVDIRALQEARAEAREAREQARILSDRWNEFLASQRKPEPEKPAIPNADQEPIDAIKWAVEQVQGIQTAREQENAEQRQAREASERQMAMLQSAGAEYASASKADPTVDQAYAALRQSFVAEAQAYRVPPHLLKQHLDQTEMQHIAFAKQNGIPIADYVKGLATARGWQPQAPQAQQPPAVQKPDLAAVAAAQQRHQSLSDAPGGDAPAPLDAKALAKMSDKEFKAWMSRKGSEAKFEEIMGA